jgi:hypothetical protein
MSATFEPWELMRIVNPRAPEHETLAIRDAIYTVEDREVVLDYLKVN